MSCFLRLREFTQELVIIQELVLVSLRSGQPLTLDLVSFAVPDHLLVLDPLGIDTPENTEQEIFMVLQSFQHVFILINLALLILDLLIEFVDEPLGRPAFLGSLLSVLLLPLRLHVVVLDELDQPFTVFFQRIR